MAITLIVMLQSPVDACRPGSSGPSASGETTPGVLQADRRTRTSRRPQASFGPRSPMAQSLITPVTARKSVLARDPAWTPAPFVPPARDLVGSRADFVQTRGAPAMRVPAACRALRSLGQGSVCRWTAQLGAVYRVPRQGRQCVPGPMTKELADLDGGKIWPVAGWGFGITLWSPCPMRTAGHLFPRPRRAHVKILRHSLERGQTPSARRCRKRWGPRDNRGMKDMTHRVSTSPVALAGARDAVYGRSGSKH